MSFVVFSNPDKNNHEKWYKGRSLLNIPSPFRALITGPPNAGKTMSVLNLIGHQNPPFKYVFLMHPTFFNYDAPVEDEKTNSNILVDPKDCEVDEYKYVDWVGLQYIPSTSFFEAPNIKSKKKCLIIDDIDLKQYATNKRRNQRLNKILTYCSTHCNLSIIICSQDIYKQVVPTVYRTCNFFSIYQFKDNRIKYYISENVGNFGNQFNRLMNMIPNDHDCVQIDYTTHTPARFRINFTKVVDLPEEQARPRKRRKLR